MMKIKCKVCGCEFNPIIEKHYVSRDTGKSGVVAAFSKEEEKLFDTFDCPECGCQVVIQERKRAYIDIPYDDNEEDSDDEDEISKHDGCVGCRYECVPEHLYPCRVCKSSYEDMYKREEEDEND